MGLFDSIGESLGGEASKASVYLGVETGGVKKGLAEATSQIEGAGSRWGTAFKFASVGLAGFATAFIGFAVDGVKEAAALNAAIARIGAQAGLTTVEMAKMRSGIVDMSTRVPQSVGQITASIEAVTKSGYNWAESLKIQEAAAKVATVTHADLASVTNTVVTAMKGWSIGAADVTKVTDTLLTTVGHSRIGFDDLGRIIATAAPLAKDLGVTFNDLNASIIAVGRSGLAPRRAGSGLIALLRGMASPAAQKEYALLGLTINATTIKQKGLLATLQEIQAAAHKNVNVIVRTKVVHVDLTKATEALRLAELRLSEVRNKNKTSPSQLLAAQDRVTNAQNRLNAAMAKGSGGQIDYAKSAAATAKANKSVSATMQLMTGGAAGQIIADTLLLNKGADQKAGLDALAKSAEATAKEFKAVLAADPGAQMAILVNVIKTFADELGVALLPSLITFIGFLQEAIPNALRGIGMLWDNYLKAPVTAMVGSFLSLVDAFSKAMGFGQGSSGGGGAVLGFFTTLSSIAATVATDLSKVFDLLASILSLPTVKSLMPFVVGGAGITLLLSGAASLVKSLTGKALGLVNTATGGIFKLGQSGAEKLPLDKSAAGLNEAAAKLTESAAKGAEAAAKQGEAALKLSEAAGKLAETTVLQKEGVIASAETAINAPEAIRNQTYIESTIEANQLSIENLKYQKKLLADQGVLIEDTTAVADAALTGTKAVVESTALVAAEAKQAIAVIAAGAGGIGMTDAEIMAARLKSGASGALSAEEQAMASAQMPGIRGTLRGAAGSALGSAGGLIGGLISKAIVPLLVAQLAGEIVKPLLGGFIAENTQFKEAGEKIKTDLLGGLVDLMQSVAVGTSAWVGKAEFTTIGNARIKTLTIARLGFTGAQIDSMVAPTLEGGGLELKRAVALRFAADVRNAKINIPDLTGGGTHNEQTTWSNDPLGLGNHQVDPNDYQVRVIQAAYDAGLTDSLKAPADAKDRTAYIKTLVDKMVKATVQPSIDALNVAVVGAIGGLGFNTAIAAKLPQSELDRFARLFSDNLGGQYDGILRIMAGRALVLAAGTPDVGALVTPESLARGTNAGGEDRGAYITARQTKPELANAAFQQNLATSLPTMQAAYRAWVAKIASQPHGEEELTAGQAFVAAIGHAISTANTDAAKLAVYKKFQSLYGNIGPALAKDAKTVTAEQWAVVTSSYVAAMTAGGGDLQAAYTKQYRLIVTTAAKSGSAQAAPIAAAIFFGDNATAFAAAKTDKAKAALLAAYNEMLPKASALSKYNTLNDAFTAWTKTGSFDPTKINIASAAAKTGGIALNDLGTAAGKLPPLIDAVTGAFDRMRLHLIAGLPADQFKGKTLDDTPTVVLGGPRPAITKDWNGKNGPGAAAGGVFQANKATNLTFGEAGRETAIIVKDPMRTTLAGLMVGLAGRGGAMPGGLPAPGGAGGGSHQNLYVDNMHVTSAPSEWSILQTLAFMSPGGLD